MSSHPRLRGTRLGGLLDWLALNATPPKGGVVLDVGAGSSPVPRADVSMDMSLLDDLERPGQVVIDKPFVVGDVTSMPFRDKAFDFIYCNHLIEHLDDPALGLSELQRCGKAGYIETPSIFRERLYDFPFHRWMVTEEDGVLVLIEKTEDAAAESLKRFAAEGMRDGTRRMLQHVLSEEAVLGFMWSDSIPFRVVAASTPFARTSLELDLEPRRLAEKIRGADRVKRHGGVRARAKYELAKWVSAPSRCRDLDLHELLVCPGDRGSLRGEAGGLVCERCGARYPVIEGVPILLEEAASEPAIAGGGSVT